MGGVAVDVEENKRKKCQKKKKTEKYFASRCDYLRSIQLMQQRMKCLECLLQLGKITMRYTLVVFFRFTRRSSLLCSRIL